MTKKDYYEILNAKKTDSEETIKKNYKKLAIKFHPDKAPEDKKKEYEEKFKEINEAYNTLSNPEKKRQYDAGGQMFNGHQGGMGGFSDIFEELLRGSGFQGFSRRQEEDLDMYQKIIIEFEEAAFGTEKEISLNKNMPCKECKGTGSKDQKFETCNECNGTGQITITRQTPWGTMRTAATCNECNGNGKKIKHKCSECEGLGITPSKEKIKIKIPEGIDDGQTIRMQGQGNTGKNNTKGDLFIEISVKPHKTFKRDRFDVYMKFPISFSKAALGGEVKIPTLEKEIKVKIAKGTDSGTVLRLKERGIPFLNNPYRKGDIFVEIIVQTPKKLSRTQKKLFKELEKLEK